MATTTNYGWTTPDDTSLVKDGASAIRTLGSSIDTSLNNALGTKKAGLVLLNTTSFSAVSSQSFNDVFSSSYRNYKILFSNLSSSTFNNIQIRLRVSGTDNSSTNYTRQYLSANNASIGGARATGQTSWAEVALINGANNENSAWLDIFDPFTSTYTTALNQSAFLATGNMIMTLTAYGLTVNTSYTGFTALASGGTMSGTISVYGYNN